MAWEFNRGLDDEFIAALKSLANTPSWFADVIADPDLFIGIRKNYFNVYSKGQSLFKAVWNPRSKHISVSTHVKYLVDPRLKKQISLSGDTFDIYGVEPLANRYLGVATLHRMKEAAKYYSGEEKTGLHDIVKENPHIIDLEVALSEEAEAEDEADEKRPRSTVPRIDVACFVEIDGKIHLRFWEAKHYDNAALWSAAKPPVIAQVEQYRALVRKYERGLLNSYRRVATNLQAIADMAGRSDQLCPLVQAVGSGREIFIDEPAFIGVIVFDYKTDQGEGKRHKSMCWKIKQEQIVLAIRGSSQGFKLASTKFYRP
jgi:hypothetical protein